MRNALSRLAWLLPVLLLINPAASRTIRLDARGTSSPITAAIVQAVAPAAASCANVRPAGQCRTAAQAAGPIAQAFSAYGITDRNSMAAVLSLMAFE